jgi:general secretion pathway protein A
MSYEEFFHLKDAPFRLTPDPDYFFPSGVHKEALDTMVYSIRTGEGFVMITGTPGVGKTLLVRKLLRELGDKVNLALVLNPTISPRELLSVILDDLGITTMEESQNVSQEMLLRRFRDNLLNKSSQGIKTIIIIDEAQNLPKATLEELRMLSNLESDKEKLLQIILVGQLELEERLQYDEMKQLAQRITIRYRLTPLSSEETGAVSCPGS